MTDRDALPLAPASAQLAADRATLDAYAATRVAEDSADRLHWTRVRHQRVSTDPTATPDECDAASAELSAATAAHASAQDAANRASAIAALARQQATAERAPRPAPGALTSTVTGSGSLRTVSLAGDLDLASAPDADAVIRRLLETDGLDEVQVDLADVAFLDSSGLRTLVELRATAATLRTTLRLVRPNARLRRTLAFAHLDELVSG